MKPVATINTMKGVASLEVYDDDDTPILTLAYDAATDLVSSDGHGGYTLPAADFQELNSMIQQWLGTVLGAFPPKISIPSAYAFSSVADEKQVVTVVDVAMPCTYTYDRAAATVTCGALMPFSAPILVYQRDQQWAGRYVAGVN